MGRSPIAECGRGAGFRKVTLRVELKPFSLIKLNAGLRYSTASGVL